MLSCDKTFLFMVICISVVSTQSCTGHSPGKWSNDFKPTASVPLAFTSTAYRLPHTNITIPLDKPITWENKELYANFLHINQSSLIQINFGKVNKSIDFIIFQVHSHIYNVTVYNNTNIRESSETGTNIGFYSAINALDTFYILNTNNIDLKLFVAVHGYATQDPIPGGCNMEFPQPVSPYIRIQNHKDYIFVDASPAKAYNNDRCLDVGSVTVHFYRMYLVEKIFDSDAYFNGIMNMMTLDHIRENGDEIPSSYWPMRRMVSAYPGTGSVFVAVAFSKNRSFYSVYSPSYTYACTPVDEGCDLLDDLVSRFICAMLLFIGLFICFFGHRFFKTEMFIFGLLSGVVITYILISLIAELDRVALLSASVLSGVFFGAIWYLFWWFYGIPVISVMLPALNLGFLVASIFYYKLPGGIQLLQLDINFWSMFIFIMLFVATVLVSMTWISNILCCALLGAYAVIYPLDFYFGSNLKYIIINIVRRAVVPMFNKAVLSPPFQWRDALITVIWVALAISGFLFQQYYNRGRSPFPPPPRSISPRMPESVAYGFSTSSRWRGVATNGTPTNNSRNERTPLLA